MTTTNSGSQPFQKWQPQLELAKRWLKYKLKHGHYTLSLMPFRWLIPVFWIGLLVTLLVVPNLFFLSHFPFTKWFIWLVILVAGAESATDWWREVEYDYQLHRNPTPLFLKSWEQVPRKPGILEVGKTYVMTEVAARRFEFMKRRGQAIIDARKTDSQGDKRAFAERWGRGDGAPEILTTGYKDWQPFRLSFESLSRHLSVVAGPGGGKTNFLMALACQKIRDGGPFIYLDPKGDQENCDTLYNCYVQEVLAGRRRPGTFRMLSPFSDDSDTYNLLHSFRSPDDLANRLVSMMPVSPTSEPYHLKLSETTAKRVIRAMVLANETVTLRKVLNLISFAAHRQQLLVKLKNGKHQGNLVFEDYEAFCKLDQDTIKQESNNLRTILYDLTADNLDAVLSCETPSLVWPEALENDYVVYINTGGLNNDSISESLAKGMTRDILEYIGLFYTDESVSQGRESLNLLFLIDEAHNAANKAFIKALATVRGAGVAMGVATQSYADLEEVLGKAGSERFLGNTITKIALRVTDVTTIEKLVKLVPQGRFLEFTDMDAINPSTTTLTDPGLPFSDQYRKGVSEVERELFTGQTFAELPTGVGIWFSGGTAGVFQAFVPPPIEHRYDPKTRM